MSPSNRLEAKIEAQLPEWAAELENLKARADKTVAEARKEYYEHVDELREQSRPSSRRGASLCRRRRRKRRGPKPPREPSSNGSTRRSRRRSGSSGPSSMTCGPGRSRPSKKPSVWRRRCAPSENPPAPPSAS
jgi:hypothetical protein